MIQFIQNLFLGDVFIFLVLFVVLIVVTNWARGRREYTGYLLGWMIGIFFVIIYGSITGPNDNEVAAQVAEAGQIALGLGQVIVASLIGLLTGAGIILFIKITGDTRAKSALKVAIMTGLSVIVLFLMFVVSPETRRMIGIAAFAFGIAALLANMLYTPPTQAQAFSAQAVDDFGDPHDNEPSGQSRLDRIRNRMQNRNR